MDSNDPISVTSGHSPGSGGTPQPLLAVPPPLSFPQAKISVSTPPSMPPPRKQGRGWKWIGLLLLLISVISIGLLVAVILSKPSRHSPHGSVMSRTAAELEEIVLKDAETQNQIAVVSIEGVISGSFNPSINRTQVDFLRDQLDRAAAEGVKAVILKVDSPGGEVLASDEMYLILQAFQKVHSIPVIASMGSLAASGGYYVSAPCRWIVVNELTMTGSIGVIFHSYNYRGLMDKVGIRPDITKSGRLKDMMSGEKLPEDELPEERRIMQGLINESYAKFKSVIREGRRRASELNKKEKIEGGRNLSVNWQDFADGRILSGNQALEIGLVDEIGNFEVAVDRALNLAGIKEAKLVEYQASPRFGGLLSLLSQARAPSVKLDLGLPLQSALPQGRLYFMSAVHLH